MNIKRCFIIKDLFEFCLFYLLVVRSATFIVYWRGFCPKFLGFGGEGNSAHISRLMKQSALSLVGTIPHFTKGISACRGTQSELYIHWWRQFLVHMDVFIGNSAHMVSAQEQIWYCRWRKQFMSRMEPSQREFSSCKGTSHQSETLHFL